MKLTKFTHACLLAETPEAAAVFDPGNFSWEAGQFDVQALTRLDDIVITHEHPDHFHLPFVQALVEQFPQANLVAPPPVAGQLKAAGLQNVTTDSTANVEVFSRQRHASPEPLGKAPEHIAVHWLGNLTVAGDRHDIEASKDILAYPMVAPWGSAMAGAAMVARLKPKVALPLHDWHWRDEARIGMYDRLEAFFAEQKIRFLKPVDAEPIEV